jgi:hypothetical protein
MGLGRSNDIGFDHVINCMAKSIVPHYPLEINGYILLLDTW